VSTPRLTVVFLLYRAAREVEALVASVLAQRHPGHRALAEWLEVLVMDDASGDGTADAVRAELARRGGPPNIRLVANERNLGLAATLNKAMGLVRTPYALTCHLDCRFGHDGYAAAMLDLLDRHPRAAAITGQPTVGDPAALPFVEKLNVVTNLMDVFPRAGGAELVPVGFAEGRCDAFRVEALREVGLWDETLRLAGEDQVLAAKLRAKGYEVYQAPGLPYRLGVSGEQDSVRRLMRHQRLFGRAHPTILLATRGTRAGVAGAAAGGNRRARAGLRLVQLAATGTLLAAAAGLGAFAAGRVGGAAAVLSVLPFVLVLAAKAALFRRHLRFVPLRPGERAAFWLLQPFLDASYTLGLAQGLVHVARRSERIS
jgi:GT2 family glycosyltransferase